MIDASIISGLKPFHLDSPDEVMTKRLTLQDLMRKSQEGELAMQDAQTARQGRNALNDLYRSNTGADGKVNQGGLLSGLAGAGQGSQIAGVRKGFLEADEAQGKVDKQKVDLIDSKLKQSRSYLDGVTTPEQYLQWHEGNHADPVLGPVLAARGVTAETARASITKALQTQGGFEQLLNQSRVGIEKFTEMNKPTVHIQNLGGTSQVLSTPGMGGAPSVLSNSPITQDANSIASNATSRANNASSNATTQRGQNMTDGRARDALEAGKQQIVQTDNGPVLVNTRTGAGMVVNGPDGQPLPGVTKPLNDGQSKALLFGSRMRDADKVLGQLASEGKVNSVAGSRAPVIGGAVNAMTSDNNQMLNQAKTDFMTAVLRRESGAAISSGEFDTANKQYFPQIGDAPGVIAQKAKNRQLAMKGILMEVPEKQRGSLQSDSTASAIPNGWTVKAH